MVTAPQFGYKWTATPVVKQRRAWSAWSQHTTTNGKDDAEVAEDEGTGGVDAEDPEWWKSVALKGKCVMVPYEGQWHKARVMEVTDNDDGERQEVRVALIVEGATALYTRPATELKPAPDTRYMPRREAAKSGGGHEAQ